MEEEPEPRHEEDPQIVAAAKQLMKEYPHLDYLQASTIVWWHLKYNPMG